jgi:hypothetical protein
MYTNPKTGYNRECVETVGRQNRFAEMKTMLGTGVRSNLKQCIVKPTLMCAGFMYGYNHCVFGHYLFKIRFMRLDSVSVFCLVYIFYTALMQMARDRDRGLSIGPTVT